MAIYRKRTPRRRIVLAVLVLISAALITLDFRSGAESSGLRKAMLELTQPIEAGVGFVTRPIGNFFTGLIDGGNLKAENEALREENESLRKEKVESARLKREVDQLESLTNLQNPLDFDYLAASVVGLGATNFDNTLSIGAGTNSGVADGNPVVTGDGLVGRVVDASSRGAKVLLLSDPQSSVAVRDSRSGVNGILTGLGRGRIELEFVDVNADVSAGDVLVTSGFEGSRFPPNIQVGRVTKVEKDASGLVLAAEVEQFDDPTRRAYVSVLLWTPPQ